MSVVCRALLLFCVLFVICQAYSRMELEDRMQMSRFHEPGNTATGTMGDDPYLRYLSEYFGRPVQQRSTGPSYFQNL